MHSVICGLVLMAFAGTASASATTYTIGYGDTLWDLSIRFYGTPDYWDDILAANPSIMGVEYLVPGMDIVLPDIAGTVGAPAPTRTQSVTVAPAPTLTASTPIISRIRLESAGFVAVNPVPAPGVVLAVNVEDQGIVSNDDAYAGDLVEIDMGTADGVSVNSVFKILNVGEQAVDPETGNKIGTIVRVAGLIRILEPSENTSIALVEHSNMQINAGDLVVVYERAADIPINTRPASEDMTAWVIGLQNPLLTRSYTYDVVYLNRGSESGLRPGDVFVVYNYGDMAYDISGNRVVTADIPISELVILTTERTTCSALVSANITGDLIEVGDRIHLARRQSAQTGSR